MTHVVNAAIEAAQNAQEKINACLDAGQSFRLEAGAGAGKTYSLVAALKRLIDQRGTELLQSGQKIACITYTEVARDEISAEIEAHPAILVETIHAFSWAFISRFQKSLRDLVSEMERREEKIAEGGGLGSKPVEYDLGFFGVDEYRITLAHDDVPLFLAKLLLHEKFRSLLKQQFPVIFIDEYQDTDKHVMAALTEYFFNTKKGPLIGLFGDHWQTIYESDFDLIQFPIEGIDKGSNFRSVTAIVDVLNELRPELPQAASDSTTKGEARFFHANSFTGERTNTTSSKGDVPAEKAKAFRHTLLTRLQGEGWDLSKTKVLILTHNAIAAEQGYPSMPGIFEHKEAFTKKEDPTIKFLADVIEPVSTAFARKQFGEMFKLLGSAPAVRAHADKIRWLKAMEALDRLRLEGSIGQVLDHLKNADLIRIPDKVSRREEELASHTAEQDGEEPKTVARQRQLRGVAYRELIELSKFVEGSTPFATQHSVKGAEFENVIVVLGGGWNHYNWPRMLELLETKALDSKNTKGFYRARNLFYVSVSRPMKRLAVLATQTMSETSLKTAARLFGADNIEGLILNDA